MKIIHALAAAAALVAGTPSFAAPTLITFEGTTSFASIDNFYSGGTDGGGLSGPNYGISFSGAALSLANDELGPYFSHAPSAGNVMFASDSSAVMNVASGFATQLTFFYSAAQGSLDAVNIYSGLNGTGTLLASASLFGNAQIGCSDTAFCRFDLTSVMFAGVARSVDFGKYAGTVAYDNISITPVPEPASYALLVGGLIAIGGVLSRRRR